MANSRGTKRVARAWLAAASALLLPACGPGPGGGADAAPGADGWPGHPRVTLDCYDEGPYWCPCVSGWTAAWAAEELAPGECVWIDCAPADGPMWEGELLACVPEAG
ncbi:MAG TPA: hypothetical protein VEA41_09885 [Salinarimonas sp.]|nr:hypothetical protein [Salinarimonas sp.]